MSTDGKSILHSKNAAGDKLVNEIIMENDTRNRREWRIGGKSNRNDGTSYTTVPMWKRKRNRRIKNKMAKLSRKKNRS